MWLLIACAAPRLVDAEVTTADAVSTVGVATWTTDRPSRTRIRYETPDRELTTPWEAEPSEAHRAWLVGVPADTAVDWTIEDDGGRVLGTGTWTSGSLPAGLPAITTDGGTTGHFMVTTLLGGSSAAVILDPEGRIVWYHEDDSGLDAYRAALARDGSGVRYAVGDISGDASAAGELRTVSWDGATASAVSVPHLAQDFTERADGTILAITAEIREGEDGDPVKGNAVVELPPGGTPEAIWTSWDCFDPATHPSNDPLLGWTWVNALDYDDATDTLLLSARNLSSIVWVDRATATCTRVLGGLDSSYEIVGERFLHTHQLHAFDDHLLVFDNDGAGLNRSRVLEYVLDDAAGTATQVWDYTPDPAVSSFVLGDVTRLQDGGTFVAFSLAGRLDLLDASDNLVFWADLEDGHALGYVTLEPTLLP